ncbi:hypothetical protein [Lentimonas sp. CC4]|uniref:hypothetical protein n=1 Tax=Lentimonas sp. CC4 TaxID=2676099 RepID=UPI00138A139A|nr:hypothetical protein [Lentimonas sp. CC4]
MSYCRCNEPKPVPGSATLGFGAGVLCCGLKTGATALVLWLGGRNQFLAPLHFGSVLWLGGRNQFLAPLRLGSVLGFCSAAETSS